MQHDTTAISSIARQELAAAEADALRAEVEEQAAYERFDALRSQLEAQGKAHEATQHPEFQRWMSLREVTDLAWGRWAMAMDALPAAQA